MQASFWHGKKTTCTSIPSFPMVSSLYPAGLCKELLYMCCKANVSLEQWPPEIRSFCDVKRFSRACAHKWKGMLLKAGNDLEKFQFLITP